MTDKKPNKGKNTLQVVVKEGEPEEKKEADMAMDGVVNSSVLIHQFSKLAELDITQCVASLREKSKTVVGGDLSPLETMLTAQATALDTLFNSLALAAKSNMGEYMSAAEKYMRLALKAQSQCRTTIETLVEMKNPQPFIQNNKAQYQQVNNTVESDVSRPVRAGARAGENKNNANELMEDSDHEKQWMDGSTPQKASRADSDMATVEA